MASHSTRKKCESIAPELRRRIRARLLDWYDRNRRDLPWRRRSADPYAQWVAEIMLQQTRVETVLDYYERFLKRFPTVASLARTRHQTVLKHWEGLGYYRRILHLHEAARGIAANGRVVPRSAEELRKLKGVGDYTAAAIASIAYGEPVAAVDGNVARAIARLFAIDDDILSSRGKRRIQTIADQLVSRKRPGDFNQAWMDLGSLICTPQAPKCGRCPLSRQCTAHQLDRADELPIRGANRKKVVPAQTYVVGLFTNGDRVLVRRRPTGGLWSGLWEFPVHETTSDGDRGPVIREWSRNLGLGRIEREKKLGSVCHQLTHRRVVFEVHHVIAYRAPASTDGRTSRGPFGAMLWARFAELDALPQSTAQRKVLQLAKPVLERAGSINRKS